MFSYKKLKLIQIAYEILNFFDLAFQDKEK